MYGERKPLSLNTIISESDTSKYTIKSILGYGGTGITYKCISTDGNYYCLKELYPTELAESLIRKDDGGLVLNDVLSNSALRKTWAWYKENLFNEAIKQNQTSVDTESEINDPYFLKSYGIFTASNGNLYARYALQKGDTLSLIIDNLPIKEILSVLITACKKLESLHTKKGLLHLDLSPANIYVIEHARGKEAYLIDFGNSKSINETNEYQRYSATDGYSSQEVLAKSEGNSSAIYKVAPSSDTYSLVAILFRALTGETFSFEHRINPEIWKNKVYSKLRDSRSTETIECLVKILRKGLSEQQNRYQSANELLEALLDANKLINGNNIEINILIKDIDIRIVNFEKNLQEIKDEVVSGNEKTRKRLGILAACLTAVILGVLAIFIFGDFEAPKVQLIGVKITEENVIEIGTSLDFCFQFYDNKGIKYQKVTENDIILDGIVCEKYFEENNGFYKLTLMNIQKTSENTSIIIKKGCAEDYNKNENYETKYKISFADSQTDITVPTLGISHPVSSDGSKFIKAGTDISFSLYLSDNNHVAKENVGPEYIRAVGFSYQDMNITGSNGEYNITITNVQGTTGKYHIYIAPGIAIDDENNYSFGLESSDFYLYNNSEEIDESGPAMTISNPEITGSVVEYRIAVNDNVNIRSFYLTEDQITPVGFSADIDIEYVPTTSVNDSVRIVRFTNIKNTSNSNEKYFIINSGVATDNFDNQTKAKISPVFAIPE